MVQWAWARMCWLPFGLVSSYVFVGLAESQRFRLFVTHELISVLSLTSLFSKYDPNSQLPTPSQQEVVEREKTKSRTAGE